MRASLFFLLTAATMVTMRLLGFLTLMHGDAARGHGVEKEWD